MKRITEYYKHDRFIANRPQSGPSPYEKYSALSAMEGQQGPYHEKLVNILFPEIHPYVERVFTYGKGIYHYLNKFRN